MESPPPEDRMDLEMEDGRVSRPRTLDDVIRRKSWRCNEDGVLHDLMDAVLESERTLPSSDHPSWFEPLLALEHELVQMIDREAETLSSGTSTPTMANPGNFPWFALGRSPSVCYRIWQDCELLLRPQNEVTRRLVCRAILCFVRVSHHRPELRRALMQAHALDITFICWLSSDSDTRTMLHSLWPHFSVNLLGSDVSSLIHTLNIVYAPEYADDPTTSQYLAWTFKDILLDYSTMDVNLATTLTAMSFLINNHPQSLAKAFEDTGVAQAVCESMARQLVQRRIDDDATWDVLTRGMFLLLHLTADIRTLHDLVANYEFLSILAEAFVESCRRGCTPVYWRFLMSRLIHSTLCLSRTCCARKDLLDSISGAIRRELDPIWQPTLSRLRQFDFHDNENNKVALGSERRAELSWISTNARQGAKLWEELITASEAARKIAKGGKMKPRWNKAILTDW